MQLYDGLPVITNKITKEEQQGIPHHLLGCIGLHEQTWVVGTFVREALKTIAEIRSRGRLPILVGGTHYYTQSLLFEDKLAEDGAEDEKPEFVEDTGSKWPILKEPTEVVLEELRKVDPVMAERWHPNDRRKIRRSLEIYLQTGRKASDIYAEQRARKGRTGDEEDDAELLNSPSMRFPTLLLWVHANADALRERLDKRVDKMLERGLLEEVETLTKFADEQAIAGTPVDETRGIWVSIGYKEFKDHARFLKDGGSDGPEQQKLISDAREKTQIATRQYSKRQVRWLRIKLVNALAEARSSESLYLLDGSDVAAFDENVVQPALALTGQYLRAEEMPLPSSLSAVTIEMLTPKRNYDLSANPEKWSKQYCAVCDVTCVTPEQWQQHTKSKTHRKLTSKRQVAEQGDALPR